MRRLYLVLSFICFSISVLLIGLSINIKPSDNVVFSEEKEVTKSENEQKESIKKADIINKNIATNGKIKNTLHKEYKNGYIIKHEYNNDSGEIVDEVYQNYLQDVAEKDDNIEILDPNMLIIPSADINIQAVVGGFTQMDVDSNNVTYVQDWSNFMNCDLYFGHNFRELNKLVNTEIGDIITTTDSNGITAHYKVTSSRGGVLEESKTDKGELFLAGVHYNRGFIKDVDTGEIIFSYSDDGFDNNNLVVLTCYDNLGENGRWVVYAERVEEEQYIQQELFNSRLNFKRYYLAQNLYSIPNTITYVKNNYNYPKTELIITLKYEDDTIEEVDVSKVLERPVYILSGVKPLDPGDYVVISDSSGNFTEYRVISVDSGKRQYGSMDEETGYNDTYVMNGNEIVFSYNGKMEESCEAVIDIKLDGLDYICRLM